MLKILRNVLKGPSSHLHRHYNKIQTASLTGRTTRGGPLEIKKSLPYERRFIWEIEAMLDSTILKTENENAKLIVVDGPIGCGKSAVIKLLAEEFDMKYIEEPTMDQIYITRSGFDLRNFDDQLPEILRTFDHRNFCIDPKNKSGSGSFQIKMLWLRFAQYIDALAHILNTGQGVILERSYYSDCAFAKAMFLENYISKEAKQWYFDLRETCDPLLLRPHVVIYLNVPVKDVMDRIKKRNLSYEVNGKALTQTYLQNLENTWKYDYLKEADQHSEILIYNWVDGGDVDTIVEDLEKLNLNATSDFGKCSDWRLWPFEWRRLRMQYTNKKINLLEVFRQITFDVPEFQISSELCTMRQNLYKTAPGNEFAENFNYKTGDSIFSILLGINKENPRSIGSFYGY